MSIYYEQSEFIFKTDFTYVSNDINRLISNAENYLHALKEPNEFWEKSEQLEQLNKINEVKDYLNKLNRLLIIMMELKIEPK